MIAELKIKKSKLKSFTCNFRILHFKPCNIQYILYHIEYGIIHTITAAALQPYLFLNTYNVNVNQKLGRLLV